MSSPSKVSIEPENARELEWKEQASERINESESGMNWVSDKSDELFDIISNSYYLL